MTGVLKVTGSAKSGTYWNLPCTTRTASGIMRASIRYCTDSIIYTADIIRYHMYAVMYVADGVLYDLYPHHVRHGRDHVALVLLLVLFGPDLVRLVPSSCAMRTVSCTIGYLIWCRV
ncbi:MAG: hypothetical protein WC756_08360 [Taibaiella sp.]|jgi:hypothetical protein